MKIRAMKMESESASRSYSQEEVNAILRRALERQGPSNGISHDELVETARELGIEPAQLEAAAIEQQERGAIEAAQERWKVQRRKKFFGHLRTYLIVNFILLVLNIMTGEAVWFVWPLFGWGIGVAFDAKEAFWPEDRDIARGARRMLEREEYERRKLEKKNVSKSFTLDSHAGKIIIERGDKRIEIG